MTATADDRPGGGGRYWAMMLVMSAFVVVYLNIFHNGEKSVTGAASSVVSLPSTSLSEIALADVASPPSKVVVHQEVTNATQGFVVDNNNNNNNTDADLEAVPGSVDDHQEPLRDYQGRLINPNRSMDAFSFFKCPRFRINGNDADKKKISDHITKYSRYASQYCASTGMMQMNVPQSAHLQILSTIARIAKIKKNDVVFDWGSGCGTMLNFFHLQFNTTGLGLDMTEGAVRFSWKHAQPNQTFCWLDGTDMSIFPSAKFDAVVTWGSLYHVRRTQVQCDIVTHFVRILKPGGTAFVGHIRTDKSQEYWKKGKCNIAGASIVRYRDYKTFRQNSWKRHGFFSMVVSKHP